MDKLGMFGLYLLWLRLIRGHSEICVKIRGGSS
jgi:hypothetical protein